MAVDRPTLWGREDDRDSVRNRSARLVDGDPVANQFNRRHATPRLVPRDTTSENGIGKAINALKKTGWKPPQ